MFLSRVYHHPKGTTILLSDGWLHRASKPPKKSELIWKFWTLPWCFIPSKSLVLKILHFHFPPSCPAELIRWDTEKRWCPSVRWPCRNHTAWPTATNQRLCKKTWFRDLDYSIPRSPDNVVVLANQDIIWLQVSMDNVELVHVPHLSSSKSKAPQGENTHCLEIRFRNSYFFPYSYGFPRGKPPRHIQFLSLGHQTPMRSCLVYALTFDRNLNIKKGIVFSMHWYIFWIFIWISAVSPWALDSWKGHTTVLGVPQISINSPCLSSNSQEFSPQMMQL